MKLRTAAYLVLLACVALLVANVLQHAHRVKSGPDTLTVTSTETSDQTDVGPIGPAVPPGPPNTGPGPGPDGPPKGPPVEPPPILPSGPTPLRVADDAGLKNGDFWLEQPFVMLDLPPGIAAPKENLLELYIAIDPNTLGGLRIRAGSDAVILEEISGKGAEPTALASTLPPRFGRGEHLLGTLWRKGELTVWHNSELLLTWKPPADKPFLQAGKGLPSAVRVTGQNVRLGARRTLPLSDIRFDDDFMRETTDARWQPLCGRWELTGMAFPERSANPFAMRASFNGDRSGDDPLYKGRKRQDEYGLGVMISPYEGTLHIARISGGSAAARAGLQEDDIFIEIDGNPVEEMNAYYAHQLLQRGYGGTIHLKMLRPGEKKFREYTITPQQYEWATPSEGRPIPPVSAPDVAGDDPYSMIVSGEKGWSDYAAEVSIKPLGSGGAGLAVAVLSQKDYLLFRWRGPAGRKGANPNLNAPMSSVTDRIELVRVVDGQEKILAQKPAAYRPYEFYRMGIDWNGDQIKCFIDGNEMLAATVPGLKRGQIGFVALQGDPVFFDDLHVAANRETLSTAHAHERKLNDIFVFEDDMEVWANPALEWKREPETPWAIHQARFPGESKIVILNAPRFNDLAVTLFTTGANHDAADNPQFTIANGVAKFAGAKIKSTEINVGTNPIQRATLRFSAGGFEAEIDGKKVTATLDGAPPLGDRIAMRGLKNIGDPKAVRIMAANTLEYTFDTAPVDWKVESGRWGLLNKWICDPRWSWFGGRTKTIATLWNKFIFTGDTTVDAHVALMMQKDDPPYERPGDYNITLCGDGVNLDSGYTLIFGGDLNSWTRLFRKGKLVAESWNEDHRVFSDKIRHPDKPELHQRWFHLKLEKLGNTVSFYRDGMKAFSYVDPEPLPEGRIAFWTLDNGFLLSRVRIAHGGVRPAPFDSRNTQLYEDRGVINMYDGEILSRVEPQVLPRVIQDSLSQPAEAFTPAAADAPPGDQAIAKNGFNANDTHAYRVINGVSGGPFALQWKNVAIDPEHHGVVRFAYRIEPGANVDLYLLDLSQQGNPNFNVRNEGAYRWRLTGPKESNEFATLVGDVPNVQADGRWHTVQFDLEPTWREMIKLHRSRSEMSRGWALRPMIGNLDNHGYLLAGMNGNHEGAAYSISDLIVYAPREADKRAPSVKRVVWPFDPEGDGKSVFIDFDDPGGSGVQEESINITINGAAVERAIRDFNSATQRLRIDLTKIGLPALTKIPELKLNIQSFRDRADNAAEAGFQSSYVYDAAKVFAAGKPVDAPYVLVGEGIPLAMEAGPEEAPSARVEESDDAPPWTPPGQRNSVHIVNPHDGTSFGFTLPGLAYELRRFPYLEMEYKLPPESPVNLHFTDSLGQHHALILTDTGDARDPDSQNIISRCGPPPDFVADGTWHRTTVALQQLLDAGKPDTGIAEVSNFSLHDHGWRGNRRSMEYWVHDITPLAAGRSADLTVRWQSQDVTGIAAYASCLDDKPETDPAGLQEIAPGEDIGKALWNAKKELHTGWNYVHVRVKSGAGVWSAPAHRKFFLDNTPPRVTKTEPPNGGATPGQTLKIYLDDPSGIDFNSVRMNINGHAISAGAVGLTYNKVEKVLIYNAAHAGVAWLDNSDVSVEITSLGDGVGNRIFTPYTFNFRTDRSLAKAGPAISKLCFASVMEKSGMHRQIDMETSFALNFEEHIGHVHAVRDCRMDWFDDPTKAAFGRRAVQFTALQDDGDVQIMMHKNSWYLDRLPLLQFEYKCDPGMKVDLLVEVVGQWHSIRFTGSNVAPEGGKNLGAVADVVADGTWHHASVDLKAMIEDAGIELPVRIVNKIMFSTQGQDGVKRGSSLTLDNFDLSPQQAAGGEFQWEAETTPAGLAGYSTVLDQRPGTIPNPTITHRQPMMATEALSGVWYFHVRACDYAGNWGAPRTLRIDYGK